MRRLNLDQIEALEEVVRHGSFTAAAQNLHLTQPAITQKIRALEARFGVGLVRTLGKRTIPTDLGRQLLARCLPLLHEAEAIEAELRHAGHDTVQPVIIGTGATACIHLLPKLLKDLKRRAPLAEITVQTATTGNIIAQVAQGEIDVALVTGPVTGAGLETSLFRRDPLVLIAPAGPTLPQRIGPERLPALPMILYERGSATAALIAQWLDRAKHRSPIAEAMELDSTEAIKRLIEAGLGWSILPQLCVATAAERRGLQVRTLRPQLSRDLVLVRAKGRPRNPAVAMIWEQLSTAPGHHQVDGQR